MLWLLFRVRYISLNSDARGGWGTIYLQDCFSLNACAGCFFVDETICSNFFL